MAERVARASIAFGKFSIMSFASIFEANDTFKRFIENLAFAPLHSQLFYYWRLLLELAAFAPLLTFKSPRNDYLRQEKQMPTLQHILEWSEQISLVSRNRSGAKQEITPMAICLISPPSILCLLGRRTDDAPLLLSALRSVWLFLVINGEQPLL